MTTAAGVILLFLVGVLLSAFFSGVETGFYRATRVRLVLDALGGDVVSRALLGLTNRPLLLVATVLVGNNAANYVTSLAVVLGAGAIFGDSGTAAELVAPLLLAPALFVGCELLPKNLFLQAPNRLLRRGGPLLLFFVVIFFPISAVLWSLNWLLERAVGERSRRVSLILARRQLHDLMEEGHEAGVLHRAQRELAREIIAVAGRPVALFVEPADATPGVRPDATRDEALRLARRCGVASLPVERPDGALLGYVRVIDLSLSDATELTATRPLQEIPHDRSHIDALAQMEDAGEDLGRVVDDAGRTIGVLRIERLRRPLFRRIERR